MPFRCYDTLKLFDSVARHLSFTAAASELNQSKGALSYQISKLETDLGFKVFAREHRRISLTSKGKKLWHASQVALGQLDKEISELREEGPGRIAIGMPTYFSSRWLSPRLMRFIESHPGVGLRIEPMDDLVDLRASDVDVAICWGKGDWTDLDFELLFRCPAAPTANPEVARKIAEIGLQAAVSKLPLLSDSSGSEGWRDWHEEARYAYNPGPSDLVLSDSNVRVQAVIDGQGLALWDALIEPELISGALVYVSDVRLDAHGYYLVYPNGVPGTPVLKAFRSWIVQEAGASQTV